MRRRLSIASIVFALAVLAAGLVSSSPAPIFLMVDLQRSTLYAQDLTREGDAQKHVVPVATGSPGYPTPTGRYRPGQLILNPRWTPGDFARKQGAKDMPASGKSPMGIAKIPIARKGEISIHAGAEQLVLGKPVTLGCVRMSDASMRGLLDWLDENGALAAPRLLENGETSRDFVRPIIVEVY